MAFHAYASFKGIKQGQFKGESLGKRKDKWSEVVAFEMVSEVLLNPNTGQPVGARGNSPIIVTRETGAATAQLLQALWTNELLPAVQFEFTKPGGSGPEQVYHRITLTNATIDSYEIYNGALPKGSTPGSRYENVTFRYEGQLVSGGIGLLIPLGQQRFGKWG
jgi:type VI secretion system Hcp family effector